MKFKLGVPSMALGLAVLLYCPVAAQTPAADATKDAPTPTPKDTAARDALARAKAEADNGNTATNNSASKDRTAPPPGSLIMGPAKIPLEDVATIDLPAHYIFVTKDVAATFLKKTGGVPSGLIGFIAPEPKKGETGESFIVICTYSDMGYVNDDDAAKLDANALLNTYKDSTKEQNEERKQEGLAPIFVGGWAENPRYEKSKHQVIWAIEVKDADSAQAPVVTINYNTRVLGRQGVLSLNLVTAPETLALNKQKTAMLLDKTTFVKGNRYEEYQPGKDKSSGLGLTGLILGGGALAAAAKFGVFGVLWKYILAIVLVAKKFLIILIAGLGAAISKFFRGRKAAKTAKVDDITGPPDGTV